MSQLQRIKEQLKRINKLMTELKREVQCRSTYLDVTTKTVENTTQSSDQLKNETPPPQECVRSVLKRESDSQESPQQPTTDGATVILDPNSASSRADRVKQDRAESNARLLRALGFKK